MAGGGTGGHIYPAIAIAAAIKNLLPDAQIGFIGARQGLEQKVVPKFGYPLLTVSARPFPRRFFSLKTFLSGSAMLYGIVQALKHLKVLRPNFLVGTGGYASVCALVAGRIVGAKVVLFEANSIPGRTNKLIAKIADWVATGFPEAVNFFPKGRAKYTGVPIRPEFRSMNRAIARRILRLEENETCLLVFGGSLGAQRINEALWDALPKLLLYPSLRIVHLCGYQWEQEAKQIQKALPEDLKEHYQPFGYREDMPVLLHSADIAISRAGASSIAELLVAGVPSILIPYPFAIYDHQRFNALSVVRRNAAKMVLNAELSGERICQEVYSLLDASENLQRMRESALSAARPFAAEEIVNQILSLN